MPLPRLPLGHPIAGGKRRATDVDARRASIQNELMPALAAHLPSFGLFTSVLIHAHHPAIEGIYFLPNGPVDKVKATLKS